MLFLGTLSAGAQHYDRGYEIVPVKPTPSISLPQATVDMSSLQETQINIHGRHDPCIVPRAVPVVEAAAAIALFDLYLSNH